MYPTFQHELAKARTADLHHQATRERAARTASHARRAQHTRSRPSHAATVLANRVLTALGAAPSSPRTR
jgi:hypothetical protein